MDVAFTQKQFRWEGGAHPPPCMEGEGWTWPSLQSSFSGGGHAPSPMLCVVRTMVVPSVAAATIAHIALERVGGRERVRGKG